MTGDKKLTGVRNCHWNLQAGLQADPISHCDDLLWVTISTGAAVIIRCTSNINMSTIFTRKHLFFPFTSCWIPSIHPSTPHLGCHRLSVCHSSLHFESRDAIKLQLCVQKKNNMNTSWYIKFKLILKRNKIQAQIQMFQRKTWSPSPLCSLCTPTQSIFCVFTWIFMETHM